MRLSSGAGRAPGDAVTLTESDFEALRGRLDAELRGFGSLPVPREDLVAEVMLRMLVANSSRRIACPVAYALTILRNLVRDRIRELERAQRAFRKVVERERTSGDGNGSLEDSEFVGFLLATTDLTPLQGRVIQMLYLDGKTISEAAGELSRNPGTVRQHHDRAIQKLAARAATLGVVR